MAPLNPSFVLQNRTDHTAQVFRMGIAGATTGPVPIGSTIASDGVVPGFGNQLIVTGNANLTVNVDTGLVYMASNTAWQGTYVGVNTASYVVTVPAVSATQWRSDYIVARQHDVANGDGDNNWDIIDVPGAFSSSAPGTLPALPNNSVPLAIIRVTPNMTVTNAGGTIVDARIYAPLPGVLWTTSSAKPALTCHEATMWFETDTGQLGIIVQGAYKYISIIGTGTAQDTWHSIAGGSFQNSWGLHGSGHFKYRRSLENELIIDATNLNPGNTADGTVILNPGALPSGWQVTTAKRVVCWNDAIKTVSGNLEPPALEFETDGSVQCFGNASATTRFDLYARIPLDV